MEGVLTMEQAEKAVRLRSLAEVLAEVPDPRDPHGTRYKIGVILAFTVCAMLCGARSLYAIAQWGRDHDPEIRAALGFRKKTTPCVATLHLLFKRLDRDKLEEKLGQYFAQQGLVPGDGLALDGKSLRGIHGEELPGVHLVAAYAHKAGRVLAEKGVRDKEAELTVAPGVLAGLDLAGLVVTGDALYAQRELCKQIVEQGGEYLLLVKANQPTLLDDIATLFADPPAKPAEVVQKSRHGDRREVRRLQASSALNEYSDWPHLAQVCRIEREVTRKGETKVEVAHAVTSLWPHQAGPRRLLELNRGHWGIENRLHWVRDVTLGEDGSQVRSGSAPQVMAALRNTTIGLLHMAGATNIAAALRRNAAHPEEALALLGLSYRCH